MQDMKLVQMTKRKLLDGLARRRGKRLRSPWSGGIALGKQPGSHWPAAARSLVVANQEI